MHIPLARALKDNIVWFVTKNGIFFVSSFYSSLSIRLAELFLYGKYGRLHD